MCIISVVSVSPFVCMCASVLLECLLIETWYGFWLTVVGFFTFDETAVVLRFGCPPF